MAFIVIINLNAAMEPLNVCLQVCELIFDNNFVVKYLLSDI